MRRRSFLLTALAALGVRQAAAKILPPAVIPPYSAAATAAMADVHVDAALTRISVHYAREDKILQADFANR